MTKQLAAYLALIAAAIIFTMIFLTPVSQAMGNYPQAHDCPPDKPYYSFCTDSIHDLKGWRGECRATRAEAEKDAKLHAQKEHNGIERWTGVLKTRKSE